MSSSNCEFLGDISLKQKNKKKNNKNQSAKKIEKLVKDQEKEFKEQFKLAQQYSENDKKRQLTKSEKNEVWNNCRYDNNFDSSIFRLDYFGNTIIKDITHTNIDSYRFAGEYDHTVPHSKGGRTDTLNVRLVAAKINRLKSNKNIYERSINDVIAYNSMYCVDINNLLRDLSCDLHNTCIKHNLLFTFDNYNNYWTIGYDKYRGKNIYNGYNNEYDNFNEYNRFRNYNNQTIISY